MRTGDIGSWGELDNLVKRDMLNVDVSKHTGNPAGEDGHLNSIPTYIKHPANVITQLIIKDTFSKIESVKSEFTQRGLIIKCYTMRIT